MSFQDESDEREDPTETRRTLCDPPTMDSKQGPSNTLPHTPPDSSHLTYGSSGNDMFAIAAEAKPYGPDLPDEAAFNGSSQSITESIYDYPVENGRTYHRYRAGSIFPRHKALGEKQLIFYLAIIFQMTTRNKTDSTCNRHFLDEVLEVTVHPEDSNLLSNTTKMSTTNGLKGDEFPNAEVEGTDLSPIQPTSVPENVHFFIDDANEEDWTVPQDHFDYIHTRAMLGSFKDFRNIIRQSFHYLKPGGFLESQEIMALPDCDDGTMATNWDYLEWGRFVDEAGRSADRPLNIAHKLKKWYEEAGFVDVHETVFKVPTNPWPSDGHLQLLGSMMEENLLAGLSGWSMGPLSRGLDWSKNEIEVYLVNVRKAISDRNVHAYHKIYVVWGRKPEQATEGASSAAQT